VTGGRPALTADCTQCAALCCVVLDLRAGADFPEDKPAGTACRHLAADDGCRIHATLRQDGWRGCAAYDCFGAGQRVTGQTHGGRSWRDGEDRTAMRTSLVVVRALHEMLWYLTEARALTADDDVEALARDLDTAAAGSPAALARVDVDAWRRRVGPLLERVSAAVRAPDGPDLRHADLAGQDLRPRPLRDADLRGSVLIGADLRGVRLGRADLLGADLRDADVRGTDLAGVLFLTRTQAGSVRADEGTRLPAGLRDG
jgi:hypothetical protein